MAHLDTYFNRFNDNEVEAMRFTDCLGEVEDFVRPTGYYMSGLAMGKEYHGTRYAIRGEWIIRVRAAIDDLGDNIDTIGNDAFHLIYWRR